MTNEKEKEKKGRLCVVKVRKLFNPDNKHFVYTKVILRTLMKFWFLIILKYFGNFSGLKSKQFIANFKYHAKFQQLSHLQLPVPRN